nr:TIR domain-containing protein [uncultured Desulfobacter sp.]
MKIFVSWSGEISREVAKLLKKWLPRSLSDIELFVSEVDIKAGERWAGVLSNELSVRQYAIVCLTSDNAESAWLNFEAGAISKIINESYVAPFLFNVEISNIDGPLSQFQAKKATLEGYKDLLKSINSLIDKPKPESEIEETLEIFWPKIKEELENANQNGNIDKVSRDTKSILSDVIFSINDLREQVTTIENKVSPTSSPTSRLELISNLISYAEKNCNDEALSNIAKFCQMEVNRVFSDRVLSENEIAYGQKLRKKLSEHTN